MKGRGLLGKGRYSAGLNRVSLSFRNRDESKVRRRASAAPQATRGKPSILIFYEANFVARKTRAQLNQSPRNFPDSFVFSVPNAIEILFFQIHPKCGVMGQSGKVKGSRDSPYEMEATESEESEERDKTGLAGISGNS